VAANLRLRLTGEEDRRLTKRHTEDPEAYLLYREGGYHWHKFTEEGVRTAIEYYERAIEKDPNYAPAYLGLGNCYAVLGVNYWSPKENVPKAKEFVDTALKLDNSLANAHAALALHFMVAERNWPAAEREFQLARQLDPQSVEVHHLYAFYLAVMLRLPEAIAELKAAKDLDPQAPIHRSDLAQTYLHAGQYDQAIDECRRTIEIFPQFPFTYEHLGLTYAQQGKYEAAVAALETARAMRKDHPNVLAALGYTYARWGKRDEAYHLLKQLSDLAKGERSPVGIQSGIAMIHVGLGEHDQALTWLRKAEEEGEPWLMTIRFDPIWDDLRSDPRFVDILVRMGLADKAAVQANQPIDSLAVLPFVYQSGDADAEFLAEGIPQTLSTSLAQVRTLKVRPMNAVTRFKDQAADDLFAVGRELQVQALVTGKIQKRGQRLYLTWQLADVRNNTVLDGANYSRELADLFQLQEDLAKEIAAKLQLKLTGEEQRQLAKRPTENLDAFRLYILGRVEWNKRTEEGARRANDYFAQALVIDPNYALAHSGVADCFILLHYRGRPPLENLPKAKAAALRALAIDDTLAEAHTSLAQMLQIYDFDVLGAEREFQRAIQLNPSYATAHHWYALCLASMARHEQAIAEIRRAEELDPHSIIISSAVGRMLYYSGRYDEAIEQYRKTLSREPNFPFAQLEVGMVYQQKGMHAEALAEFAKALPLFPGDDWVQALQAFSYARSGMPGQARTILEQLEDLSGRTYVSPYALALIYNALDEKDQAIAWLNKAFADRSRWLTWVKVEPMFDNLRSDPRFDAILRNMGLADKATPVRSVSESAPSPLDTLAVLPFDNQSPDPEAGYLGDDITYSLTDSLARIRELKVRPYSSTTRFKPGSTDAKTAGRELQVQAVLHGSIQPRGETVVIDVELIHVGEDRLLWSSRYPGKLAERLTLQQQIIQEVPEKLRLSLSGQEKQVLAKLPTNILKAHELYTLGRLAWNRRNAADIQKAIQYFEKAIQLDPNYALAHAGLADSYFVLPAHSRESPTLYQAKSRDAALKALALDPTLAEPHCTLAFTRDDFDFAGTERSLQLALERKPNYPTGRHWYGLFLSQMGRHDEAISELQQARKLDPDSLIIRAALGRVFYMARKFEAAEAEALAILRQVPDFVPALDCLGSVYLMQKRYPQAIKFLRDAWEREKGFVTAEAWLGYAYGASGDAARAREMLQDMQTRSKQDHISVVEPSIVHLGLGEKEQALTLLEQAYREKNGDMMWIKADPIFDSLRDDPRFQKIVADMKFPQ
jgi:tetratricopeptide (TPR) repeat protein